MGLGRVWKAFAFSFIQRNSKNSDGYDFYFFFFFLKNVQNKCM